MSEDSLFDSLGSLVSYSFVSTLVLGFSLIFLGIINDYILFEIDAIAQSFEASGIIGSWVVPIVESAGDILLVVPTVVDIIWLISFILMIWWLMETAYNSQRESYFSSVSLMLYGSLIYLFLSGIFIELSEWFNTEVLAKALPTLALSTPFYSYYLTHAGIIHALLIVISIIVNMVDFDFSTFSRRKDKEDMVETEEAI